MKPVDAVEPDEDEELARKHVGRPVNVSLAHVSAKYSVKSLGEFLFQPLPVRASGRMPDMKLTPAEALAIAGYLVGQPASPAKPLEPREELVAEGKRLFQELNCTACHALPDSHPLHRSVR